MTNPIIATTLIGLLVKINPINPPVNASGAILYENCTSHRAILYICPLNMNQYGDLISFL